MSDFAERLDAVEQRICAACDAAGRSRDDVQLVAVSKRKPIEAVREALGCGLLVFGENRVQEALQKIPEVGPQIQWHLIGPLQSNKVRHAVKAGFALIHSIHSLELLTRLNQIAGEEGRVQPVLLQVNIAGDLAKSGMKPEELEPVLEASTRFGSLEVQGLMTMPPFAADPEETAPWFGQLRELRDTMAAKTGFPLEDLSMGMSHDLDVAIREGATMVRIGTDLFGTRT